MSLPFILVIKNKKKTWCQGYCPRANLFGVLFQNRSLTNRVGPDWLIKGEASKYVLGYFLVNLFIISMSTTMVIAGKIAPVETIRFLIAFQLPWEIPQMLTVSFFPDWAVHLSFRLYSMMFTSTVIGLLLGWLFKPKTWCTVCPINTLSDLVLSQTKKK